MGFQERAMTAVVENNEKPDQNTCGRQRESQGDPVGDGKALDHQEPGQGVKDKVKGQLNPALDGIWTVIA
jgi:hypothetical protein